MADLSKIQDAIADEQESNVEAVLARGMRQAIRGYAEADVVALPPGFRDEVEAVLVGLWTASAQATGAGLIDEFRAYGFDHMETKQDEETLFERIVQEFLERFGASKVTQIVSATRDQLFRIVQQGQREGLGITQIAKLMRDQVSELSRLRAHVIARTETHTSSMYAAQQVARTSRRPLMKEWVSAEDSRTRDFGEGDGVVDEFSHRAMNGVRVNMSEPYMVPTKYGTREPLMFPGDPSGSPGNTIMCRCVETYHRQED